MTNARLGKLAGCLTAVFACSIISQTEVWGQSRSAGDGKQLSTRRADGGASTIQTKPVASMVGEGLGLLRANQNEQAATLLKRTVELYPDSPEAHHTLGLALAKIGDSDQAIKELETAKSLNPAMDSTWLTLAGLQQSLGHVDQAIALYNEFLERPEFAKRADLQDARNKIKLLIVSLTKEQQSIQAAQREAQVFGRTQGAPITHSLLPVPAQAASGTDDYVSEATRAGVMTWPQSKMPIKIYLGAADSVPGYKRQWRDILLRSFDDWSKASAGLIRFQVTSSRDDANVECYFVYDESRAGGGMDNDAEAGEAKMYMDKDGLSKGTIKILTKSLSNVLPLTDNRMRVICLHEIGHALGLAGHTANPDDIMFYSTSFKDEWRDLSGRDARTIQRLYSSK